MIPNYCAACGKRTESTLFCVELTCSKSLKKNKENLLQRMKEDVEAGKVGVSPVSASKVSSLVKRTRAHVYDSCPALWEEYASIRFVDRATKEIGAALDTCGLRNMAPSSNIILPGNVAGITAMDRFTISSAEDKPMKKVEVGSWWRPKNLARAKVLSIRGTVAKLDHGHTMALGVDGAPIPGDIWTFVDEPSDCSRVGQLWRTGDNFYRVEGYSVDGDGNQIADLSLATSVGQILVYKSSTVRVSTRGRFLEEKGFPSLTLFEDVPDAIEIDNPDALKKCVEKFKSTLPKPGEFWRVGPENVWRCDFVANHDLDGIPQTFGLRRAEDIMQTGVVHELDRYAVTEAIKSPLYRLRRVAPVYANDKIVGYTDT